MGHQTRWDGLSNGKRTRRLITFHQTVAVHTAAAWEEVVRIAAWEVVGHIVALEVAVHTAVA